MNKNMFSKLVLKSISHKINIILQTGTYSRIIKQSIVISINETGDKQKVSNYKSIAPMNIINKII